MYLKLLPALLLSTQLHAATIDLPQGSQIWQQKDYTHDLRFFDEYTESGWVSLYGILNGGTLFDTNLSTLWWDFAGSDYHLNYIVINDALDSCKIINTTGLDLFEGNLALSAFNNAPIQYIDLFGKVGLSDKAPTLTLFILGLVFLLLYDQKTAC